jgi:hypothetical protein
MLYLHPPNIHYFWKRIEICLRRNWLPGDTLPHLRRLGIRTSKRLGIRFRLCAIFAGMPTTHQAPPTCTLHKKWVALGNMTSPLTAKNR